ncbi:MAG: arsenic efflux protein [Bacteroidetes bacterium]|nr:arsenic efflux protein [Bacteroidota bacterium]
MITSFVLVMMLMIEYITVLTKGKWSIPLKKSGFLQIGLAALLGLIPGCLGTYTAVTLYSHGIFSFAAIVTAMIATSGDEAFVMFSIMPDTALKLMIILFVVATLSGGILYLIFKNKNFIKEKDKHSDFLKHEPACSCFERKEIIPQLKNISFERAILIAGVLLFIAGLISGQLLHDHTNILMHGAQEVAHEHGHESHLNWVKISALIAAFITLFIVTTSPNHFLQQHLWEHIIKKHVFKIFLWTLGALLFIHFGLEFLNINAWIQDNPYVILILAVLIGIIPESGPHILFITLFLSGNIPFSILMANSIVQDGHGALPLLAESKKSFIYMKLFNVLIGFVVGAAALLLGF